MHLIQKICMYVCRSLVSDQPSGMPVSQLTAMAMGRCVAQRQTFVRLRLVKLITSLLATLVLTKNPINSEGL